jgi:hypothetical protein
LYGFRAWFCEKPLPGFVLCPCGWGPRLGKHYAAREHVKWVKSNNNSGIDATCRRNRALAWEEVTGSV